MLPLASHYLRQLINYNFTSSSFWVICSRACFFLISISSPPCQLIPTAIPATSGHPRIISSHFQIRPDGDAAVFFTAGAGYEADGLDNASNRIVCSNDLQFHLVNDIGDEPSAAEYHYLPFLMAGYRAFHKIIDAHFIESVPYLLQLELLNDGFYQLHGTSPLRSISPHY